MVVEHFEKNHRRSNDGLFIVPLPKRPDYKPIGESRSMAVRRFMDRCTLKDNSNSSDQLWMNISS